MKVKNIDVQVSVHEGELSGTRRTDFPSQLPVINHLYLQVMPAETRTVTDFSYPRPSALIRGLKHIPQELVINLVVILNFGFLHKSTQQPGAPIRAGLLQVRIPALDVLAQNGSSPLCALEV
jgi:hypothetical protein